MKKVYQLSLLLVIGSLLFGCDKGPEPTEYNDKIIVAQSNIITSMLALSKTIETGKIDATAETQYADVLKQINSGIKEVNALGDYDGSSEFKDAAVNLFTFYKNIYEKEFRQMLDILKKGEGITEADLAVLGNLSQAITEQEKPYDAAFEKAQKNFSSKYSLTIEDNPLQEEIDK